MRFNVFLASTRRQFVCPDTHQSIFGHPSWMVDQQNKYIQCRSISERGKEYVVLWTDTSELNTLKIPEKLNVSQQGMSKTIRLSLGHDNHRLKFS